MTYQSTVRRLTLVTAILVAIGLTLFLTAPFGKGISLAQASAENTPATGAPTISSDLSPLVQKTPRVTQTLWAHTRGIEDEDGMEDASFTYQWVSHDGATDTEIAGATGRTYILQSSDEGKTVKVTVTFTDDGGNEESLTSEPTVDVVAEDAGICGRTPVVRDQLVQSVRGVNDCALARIHRRRASGQCPEVGRGCSCESGIMVLKQQSRPQNKEHPIDATTQPSRSHPNRV